ncbi:putative L-type amino acid transporter 1-like protein MLAS [Lineus longissimus]|uniref:putative L-type amino acid transporter 1-like protein MLAS n=1 Tax=Lineus longissimus TaxID=88925 RepID=UPI00315CA383
MIEGDTISLTKMDQSTDGRRKRYDSNGHISDVTADPSATKRHDGVGLQTNMTLLNGITMIVGSIIGSGIFVSPKGVLQHSGSVGASLIIWLACGLFSLCGAWCFAELGLIIPKSGADYSYILEAFGPLLAFLRLWVECLILRPGTTAIVALAFAFYVLQPVFPDCDPPTETVVILAGICISKYLFVLRLPTGASSMAPTSVQYADVVGKYAQLEESLPGAKGFGYVFLISEVLNAVLGLYSIVPAWAVSIGRRPDDDGVRFFR